MGTIGSLCVDHSLADIKKGGKTVLRRATFVYYINAFFLNLIQQAIAYCVCGRKNWHQKLKTNRWMRMSCIFCLLPENFLYSRVQDSVVKAVVARPEHFVSATKQGTVSPCLMY
jgi:hypothetical protein